MAGKNGADSLIDDSLVDDDDAADGHVDDQLDGDNNAADGDGTRRDDADAGARDGDRGDGEDRGGQSHDDLEVVIDEEATEEDARRRPEQQDAGALERTGADREDEDRAYSQKVQDRINRERRIAREARAAAEAERGERLKAERRSLDAQKEAVETTKAALELQAKALKDALVKAKEDGKTTEEVDLQDKLNRVNARLQSVEGVERQLAADEERLKHGVAAASVNARANQWLRDNPWFNNARFREQTAIARALDAGLSAERLYAKDSPEYFEELDKRIRRRLPEVLRHSRSQPAAAERGGRDGQRQQQRRDPTGGAPRGGDSRQPAAAPRKGRVVLNRQDLANMAQFGLDPKNPEHQKEYAIQKMGGSR